MKSKGFLMDTKVSYEGWTQNLIRGNVDNKIAYLVTEITNKLSELKHLSSYEKTNNNDPVSSGERKQKVYIISILNSQKRNQISRSLVGIRYVIEGIRKTRISIKLGVPPSKWKT